MEELCNSNISILYDNKEIEKQIKDRVFSFINNKQNDNALIFRGLRNEGISMEAFSDLKFVIEEKSKWFQENKENELKYNDCEIHDDEVIDHIGTSKKIIFIKYDFFGYCQKIFHFRKDKRSMCNSCICWWYR